MIEQKIYRVAVVIAGVFLSGYSVAEERTFNDVYVNSHIGNLRPYFHFDKTWGDVTGGLNFIGGDLSGAGVNLDYVLDHEHGHVRLFSDSEVNRYGGFSRVGVGGQIGPFMANYYVPLFNRKEVIARYEQHKKILSVASGFDVRLAWKHFSVGYLQHTDKDRGLLAGLKYQLKDFLFSVETLRGKSWNIGVSYSPNPAEEDSLYRREHIMRFKEVSVRTAIIAVTPTPLVVTPPTVTVTPPPVTVTPPTVTLTPPPVTVTPPTVTLTPPPVTVTVTPPPVTVTPPPVTLTPPTVTVTPPPVTVTPPTVTVTPPPVTVTPPPVTLTPPPVTLTPPPVTLTPPPVTVTPPPVTVAPPTGQPLLRFPTHPALSRQASGVGYANYVCRGTTDASCTNTPGSIDPSFTDQSMLYCYRQDLMAGEPQHCVLNYNVNGMPAPIEPFTLLEIYPDDPSVQVSVRLRIITNGYLPEDLVQGETLESIDRSGDTVLRFSGKKLIFNPGFMGGREGDTLCTARPGIVSIRVFANRGGQQARHDFELHFANGLSNGRRDFLLDSGTGVSYLGFEGC